MKNLILFLTIWALSTTVTFAQSGFNYQGVIRNSDSTLMANTDIKVQFVIYESGSEIYTENHNLVTNGFGHFTAVIGNGTPVSGTFDAINFGANDVALETRIDKSNDGTFEIESTSDFQTVPTSKFATVSETSLDNLWEHTATAVYPETGFQVGIGTSAPESQLHVMGGTDAEPTSGGTIIVGNVLDDNIAIDGNEIMARNNGIPDKLFLNNDGGDVIILNDDVTGNVGIGVNSPGSKLSVNGGFTLMLSATISLTTTDPTITVGNTSYLVLSSNTVTETNREITLTDGIAIGQILILEAQPSISFSDFQINDDPSLNNTDIPTDFDPIIMGEDDTIMFIWNGDTWQMVSYANN